MYPHFYHQLNRLSFQVGNHRLCPLVNHQFSLVAGLRVNRQSNLRYNHRPSLHVYPLANHPLNRLRYLLINQLRDHRASQREFQVPNHPPFLVVNRQGNRRVNLCRCQVVNLVCSHQSRLVHNQRRNHPRLDRRVSRLRVRADVLRINRHVGQPINLPPSRP